MKKMRKRVLFFACKIGYYFVKKGNMFLVNSTFVVPVNEESEINSSIHTSLMSNDTKSNSKTLGSLPTTFAYNNKSLQAQIPKSNFPQQKNMP